MHETVDHKTSEHRSIVCIKDEREKSSIYKGRMKAINTVAKAKKRKKANSRLL